MFDTLSALLCMRVCVCLLVWIFATVHCVWYRKIRICCKMQKRIRSRYCINIYSRMKMSICGLNMHCNCYLHSRNQRLTGCVVGSWLALFNKKRGRRWRGPHEKWRNRETIAKCECKISIFMWLDSNHFHLTEALNMQFVWHAFEKHIHIRFFSFAWTYQCVYVWHTGCISICLFFFIVNIFPISSRFLCWVFAF